MGRCLNATIVALVLMAMPSWVKAAEGDGFKLFLGPGFFCKFVNKGIVTYGSPQFVPIVTLQLYKPEWQMIGKSLTYSNSVINENWYFRGRLTFDSTFDRPFYYAQEKEADRVRRAISNELDLLLQHRWKNVGDLALELSHDLSSHRGYSWEMLTRVVLANYMMTDSQDPKFQPALFLTAGGGDKNHNEYFYGAGANAQGVAFVSWGVSVSNPAFSDILYPTIKLTRFHLVSDSVRGASFVREGERESWQLMALFALRVL